MNKVTSYKKKVGSCAAVLMAAGVMLLGYPSEAYAAEELEMSTDYPGISAKAGETVSFDLDFAAEESCDASLSVVSMPEGWSGYFRGNSSQISKVHISEALKDGAGEDLATFSLTLPDETEEGTYEIQLKADAGESGSDILTLEINVSQEEAGESDFSAEYPELQGASGTSFSFDATLANNRGVGQSYSLTADAPDGWQVGFTPSGESSQVASIEVEAGSSADLTIAITPPETIQEGTYTIPCTATSSSDTLTMDLKVKITGYYDVELTTSTGNLSLDAYSNDEESVTLIINNNGNVDLTNLELSSSASSSWEVSFDQSEIDTLAAGESTEVTAYITPDSDAMTGDYVVTLSVGNEETTDSKEFRVSVKTRTSWGIAAVAIILLLLAGIGYVFKKYGRR